MLQLFLQIQPPASWAEIANQKSVADKSQWES